MRRVQAQPHEDPNDEDDHALQNREDRGGQDLPKIPSTAVAIELLLVG